MNKTYTRLCPKCGNKLTYSSKQWLQTSTKRGALCRSCIHKEISSRPDHRKTHKGFFDKYGTKGACSGSKNPFYGKTHSNQTILLLKNMDRSSYKTKSFIKKMSLVTSGTKNPMYGKTYYQVWVSKLGKDEADKREKRRREKSSLASRGSNNSMYGKPAPTGSGCGWSGWYKGWYFRSLRELSYVVLVLEAKHAQWITCEKAGIKIPYKSWGGRSRTYTPDFFIENKMIVEIKPEKLKFFPTVILKNEAAQKLCSSKGWEYSILDPQMLSEDEIANMHSSGIIKFSDRYEKKFNDWSKTSNGASSPFH